jgi:hypothetical protein
MNRNYATPRVSDEWCITHQTSMPVAVAIHALADKSRSPQQMWEAPTSAEWDHVVMAVAEYVAHSDYEYDFEGYRWGQEVVRIKKAELA